MKILYRSDVQSNLFSNIQSVHAIKLTYSIQNQLYFETRSNLTNQSLICPNNISDSYKIQNFIIV